MAPTKRLARYIRRNPSFRKAAKTTKTNRSTALMLIVAVALSAAVVFSVSVESRRGGWLREAQPSAPAPASHPEVAKNSTVPAAVKRVLEPPSPALPFTPTVTATKVDSLIVDNDNDLKADPGDTLRYTVVIGATGEDATGVNFSDTVDPNTTFVPGSLQTTPLARNDSYSAAGNIRIQVPAPGVLANDQDFDGVGPALNVTAGTFLSAQGGNVTLNADGSFSYNPKPGYESAPGVPDTFTYTLNDGEGPSDTGTVAITVTGMIWFINNNFAGTSDGRLTNPFKTLADFQAINNGGNSGLNPSANDNIFVYESLTAYNGSVTLLAGQKFIGQDATDSLSNISGVNPPANSDPLPATSPGGTLVTITSAATALTLGSNNTVRGFTFGNAGSDIDGTGFGTLNITDVTLNGTGRALSLSTGTLRQSNNTGSATFASISSASSGTTGISLSGVAGGFTSGSTTVSGSSGIGISVGTSSATLNFANTSVSTSNSTGVSLLTNTGPITFGVLNISPNANQRGLLATDNSGNITATSGTITTSGAAGTNAEAVRITHASGTTMLTMSLTTVNANGGNGGIVLSNTGGSFTVTGNSAGLCGGQVSGSPLSITTAPNTADCTGGRIQLMTGADGAAAGIGISLTSAQNVSLTRMRLDNHSNFAIKGSSVTALTLNNVLIDGVNGSTTSPDEGSINITNLLGTSSMTNSTVRGGFEDNINILNNTGTGTFTITGSTIRDNSTTTGNDGVFGQADPGANFTLKVINSVLQRHRGDHVNTTQSGNGVINTVVTGNTMTFNGTIGQPFDLATTAGGSVTLTTGANFTGTSTFNVSNNNITGAKTTPININNTALTSTLTGIFSGTINGNTIGLTGAVGSGSDGDGIDVTANGNANITATITNNNVRQWKLLGLNMVPRDGAATMNVTVQGNTIGEPSNTTESLQAILLNAGPATTETGNTCANIGGSVAGQPNTFPGTFTAGILPIRVRQRAVNTVFLPGYGGAAFSTPNVVTYLSGRNGGAGATATANNVAGAGGFLNTPGGAPCTAGAAPAGPEQATELATLVESPKVQPVAMQSEPGLPADGALVSERKNEREAAASSSTFSSETVSGASLDPRDIQRTKRHLGMVLRYSPKNTWAPLARRQEPNATQDKTSRSGNSSKSQVTALAGETVTHSIGTLPAGKTVHIQFQVTVNSPYLGGDFVSNQGTVSGSNFSNVLTDDPAVGGANDPTTTPILQIPTVSVADASASEPTSGSTNMLFTVTLSAPAPVGGASVDFTTQDQPPALNHATAGLDYTTTTGTVNFAQGDQIKVISVPVLADSLLSEQNETFLVVLSNPVNATITNGTATGTILIKNQPGTILISEVRTSGPAGDGDDFVEIYNNTEAPHTVNDPSGGYGLFKMGADCSANPILIGVIPNGTVIPARGHYLFVGSAYSLANYGGTNAAVGDQVLSQDIENDRNVAIFSTTSLVNLSTTTRLDAVGFGVNTGAVCDLLRESTTLIPLNGSTLEYSYFRDECGKKGNPATFGPCPNMGFVQDSNVNSEDFVFVDTAGTDTPAGKRLGAPGPQNLGSARLNLSIPALLLDATIGAPAAPNRVRDLTPVPDFAPGTMSVRRRFQNNTGAPVTRLRFRIVDFSSLTSGGGIADLRAITSTTITVNGINDSATCAATGTPATVPCSVTVFGTTLEQPPVQGIGGALNSSLSAGTITLPTPLAPGASINLQFLLGVKQTGSFKFFFNIEALP